MGEVKIPFWPRLSVLHWAMHPRKGKLNVRPEGKRVRVRKCPCECGAWLLDWRGQAYLVKALTLVIGVEQTTPGTGW